MSPGCVLQKQLTVCIAVSLLVRSLYPFALEVYKTALISSLGQGNAVSEAVGEVEDMTGIVRSGRCNATLDAFYGVPQKPSHFPLQTGT